MQNILHTHICAVLAPPHVSGLSVAGGLRPHVRHTRHFVQIVGRAPRTPVCTENTRTLRRSQIRFAHSRRTPVGEESGS